MEILQPRSKPKKAYPNSDRFEEDGRRIVAILTIIASAAVLALMAWWPS